MKHVVRVVKDLSKKSESAASQSFIIVGWVGDSKPCFFIYCSVNT